MEKSTERDRQSWATKHGAISEPKFEVGRRLETKRSTMNEGLGDDVGSDYPRKTWIRLATRNRAEFPALPVELPDIEFCTQRPEDPRKTWNVQRCNLIDPQRHERRSVVTHQQRA